MLRKYCGCPSLSDIVLEKYWHCPVSAARPAVPPASPLLPLRSEKPKLGAQLSAAPHLGLGLAPNLSFHFGGGVPSLDKGYMG